MAIKDAEYHERLNEDMARAGRISAYHARQAERYWELYYLAKDRRGWKWLSRIADRRNMVHYREGMAVATEAFKKCTEEIDCLVDYLEKDT